jgi:pimeloyl-ACP methyl ester carboxylesterase
MTKRGVVGGFLAWALKSLAAAAFALVAISLIALAYRSWRQNQVAAAMAIPSPPGVVEAGYLRIGGIDQWVAIRGRDEANPVILILHGGPGQAMSPLQAWFVPWERDFTVVQWDQRGAGLTYSRYGKATPDLSQGRIVNDGLEVAEYLRKRLHKKCIVLLGHSWGSIIGLQMVERRPDLFCAYVGTGQVVDWDAQEALDYRRLLDRANAAHDESTVDALTKLGPPPYANLPTLLTERRLATAYPVASERDYLLRSTPTALFAPRISLKDLVDNVQGALFSLGRLYGSMPSFKAATLGPTFQVPLFFFQGAEDNVTPTDLVAAYMGAIQAPVKRLVLLPKGGHLALLTQTDAFLARLDADVRPIALARQ